MKKIHIEFSDERLITPSGLVFVGQILGKSSFVKKINRAPISKDYLQKQIKNGDVLLTYIGMLCQGKPQYEAVREMMDDPDYYKYALGVSRSFVSTISLVISASGILLSSSTSAYSHLDSRESPPELPSPPASLSETPYALNMSVTVTAP